MNTTKNRLTDLQKIKEDTFGDMIILRMIIEQFIEDVDEFIGALNQELPNKNWQALFQATHKIKPNISMFGITALELTILQLERSFKNEQDLDTVDELIEISLPSLEQVKVELRDELKSIPNG